MHYYLDTSSDCCENRKILSQKEYEHLKRKQSSVRIVSPDLAEETIYETIGNAYSDFYLQWAAVGSIWRGHEGKRMIFLYHKGILMASLGRSGQVTIHDRETLKSALRASEYTGLGVSFETNAVGQSFPFSVWEIYAKEEV